MAFHSTFLRSCAQNTEIQAEVGDKTEHQRSKGFKNPRCNDKNNISRSPTVPGHSVYQLQCLGLVLQPRRQGNIRLLGSLWSGSPQYPHILRLHKSPSPFHTYRPDTGLGTRSHCWSRRCLLLCRNLHKKEQLTSVSEVD